ncbi:hypothetical protein Ahy_B02g057741 [Arachis hypogaea]|uniref:Transposase MuDR plant domain-containing protein n=1 Tax=Arachis hypogaea TaxID=3818 RepID=A0A445ACQ2_ARAHY|nr:hypothetical protein Ahy_B02g057741 [Arachis hypogaea]
MSDGDAMRMGRLLVSRTVKHCSVYVVDGYREGNGVEICSNDKDYVPDEAEYSGSGFVEVEVEGESEASSEEDRFDDSTDDGDHEDHFEFDVEYGNDGGVGNAFRGFDGPLNEHDNAQTAGVDAAVNDATVRDDIEVGEISESYETEDIDSYKGDSDDIIKKRRYPKYNEAEMSRKYVFKVGLEFKSLGQFKDTIREHALLNGRDIRYIKNDKAPTTAADAVNYESPIVAPSGSSQQALPLEEPASQPLLDVASVDSQQPPRASSQPLPMTKVFGVRRSGRLKLGVRKQKGAPNLYIDLSDD